MEQKFPTKYLPSDAGTKIIIGFLLKLEYCWAFNGLWWISDEVVVVSYSTLS